MISYLQRKIPWFGTVTAVLVLLAGLSLVACSQPNDPSTPVNAAQPSISTQPQSGTWDVGTHSTRELTVAVSVNDGGTLSYQWYSNTSDSHLGSSPIGTNSTSITLNKTDYPDNGPHYFYVVVTNTNNGATGNKTKTVTSDFATVTVTGNAGGTGPLANGVWRDGELTATEKSAEYTFAVESGKTYYVWWNDSDSGPTPKDKTVDIIVSAWYSDEYGDEKTYIFGGEDAGVDYNWSTPQIFTSDRTGSVTMMVTPFNDYGYFGYGTFAVAFSTVSIRPGAAVAKTITAGQWKDDEISVNDIHVYTISVTNGTTYYVWWNDEIYGGDYTKTADVEVQARYADDTIIFNDGNTYSDQWVDTAWATPQSFTADRNGTVDLRVRAFTSVSGGTYGIVYSTNSTRPTKDNATLLSVTANGSSVTPTTALTLTFDKVVFGLTAGDITLNLPGIYDVTKGDLSGGGPSYTLGVSSPVDGTLTVTVGGTLLTISGSPKTVAVYADDSITPLVENKWVYEYLYDRDDVHWYKLDATAGTRYYFWWDEDNFDDDEKGDTATADIELRINANGSWIYGQYEWMEDDYGLTVNAPFQYAPSVSGTVYVWIRASSYNTTKTYPGAYSYGIVYSTSDTRPLRDSATLSSVTANGSSGTPTTALTLTFNKEVYGLCAADIILTMPGFFDVTKGTLSGNGPAYTLPISSTIDGTITVTVGGILLQITNPSRQVAVYGDGGTGIPELIENQWTNGDLPKGIGVADWYKITVSAGTTYRIWWNDKWDGDGSKDTDVVVGACYADGTNIFGDNVYLQNVVDNGWTTPQDFTPTANGTVFVRVMGYWGDAYAANYGTYGIVFSTGATRPAQ
jgi:hypothetical protein